MSNSIYLQQVNMAGLDIECNWRKDARERFVTMLSPVVEGTDYELVLNQTDKSSHLVEVRNRQTGKREFFFRKLCDMRVNGVFDREAYARTKAFMELPENERPNKTQIYVHLSNEEMWNAMCALVGKTNWMTI